VTSGPTGPGPGAEAAAAPTGLAGVTGPSGATGPTGPAAALPSVPSPPPPLPVTSIEARLGTATLSIAPDRNPEPVVDPAATFEVRLGVAARGTRLVLLDARDGMVPSTGDVESGGSVSRFTLVPHETLVPGSRYVLRLEGLESRSVTTDDGRSFEPVAVAFRVAGDPPPPPPKKVKKKRAR
jgi:hypothetical protein